MLKKFLINITYAIGLYIYRHLRLARFNAARTTAARCVAFLMMKQYNLQQKPIWLMSPKQGTLETVADEEIYSVKPAPYWGNNLLVLPTTFRVPPQWHASINDAIVHSPSAAVISNHILWQQEEVTALPAISSGYSRYITEKNGKFSIYTTSKIVDIQHEAALIGHRTDFNFFHVMLEVIPKIIRLKEIDPQEKMVVLLNNAPNQNIKDLLNTLAGKRPIIFLENLSLSKIKNLHLFSTPSFLPDDPIFDITKASLSCKSIPAIQENLLPFIKEESEIECLWVSRQGYAMENKKHGVFTRDIENIEQVNKIIEHYKSERFYPEKFNWSEQGQKFRCAKRIVMASGSAVANLIYCKPGTRVLLMCKNNGVNPALFFPIFEALKIEHAWVLGDSLDAQPHAQFSINEEDLKKGMNWLFEKNNESDGFFP
jgi:hypothetical protein